MYRHHGDGLTLFEFIISGIVAVILWSCIPVEMQRKLLTPVRGLANHFLSNTEQVDSYDYYEY